MAEKKTRKRTKILRVKKQQAAAKNIISSSTWYFFKEPADTKKKKNRGGKTGEASTVVPGIRITSRTLWSTTNKLEAGPAAKGRDNEGQMRRSQVCFGLVATCDVPGTHLPNAKTAAIDHINLIQMGPRKKNLVFRRSQTGEVYY